MSALLALGLHRILIWQDIRPPDIRQKYKKNQADNFIFEYVREKLFLSRFVVTILYIYNISYPWNNTEL